MIYETSSITSTSIMPHLWIYRPQITIDHVTQSLEQKTSREDLKILKKFLNEVIMCHKLLCNPYHFICRLHFCQLYNISLT